MNNKKQFDEILNIALDRVLAGEEINIVLADYPRFARELEPLLRTSLDTRSAAKVAPRPEFRRQAALDFQKAVQQMPVKASIKEALAKPQGRGIFGWGMAWSVSFAVLLVVLLSGTGVVAASSRAMPDSPLYSVKLATESVQYALTPTESGKAELLVALNTRRVNELVNMADKGNVEAVSVLNSRVASNMEKITGLTSGQMVATAADRNMLKGSYGLSASSQQTESTPAPATAPAPTATMTTTAAMTTTARPQTTVASATTPPRTTTAAPTTTQITVATATVPPQPVVTPTLTVILPPVTSSTSSTVVGASGPENDSSSEGSVQGNGVNTTVEGKWGKLRQLMTEAQYKNLQDLMAAYNRAPDYLKPLLQETIDLILQGYDLTLSNLLP